MPVRPKVSPLNGLNNFAVETLDRLVLPLASAPILDGSGSLASDIAEGDLVGWDAAAGAAVEFEDGSGGDSWAGVFVGVAEFTVPSALATINNPDRVAQGAVRRHGSFWFFTTSGDTYHPGDAVYNDLVKDDQTITNTKAALTTVIGYVDPGQFLTDASAFAGIMGGFGIRLRVMIEPNWPAVA